MLFRDFIFNYLNSNFTRSHTGQAFGGVSSSVNSAFSDIGISSSSFGKGLRKRKPSYQISEESEEENVSNDAASYEVNYKTKVTHKPGPSFDSGSFKFSSVTAAPSLSGKTKFGSSNKFSSFGSLNSGSSNSGLFKFNEPSSSLSNSGQITTKFAVNHPAPTNSASSLGGSYQTFPDEGFGTSSGQLNDKFNSDYHSSLAKLKTDSRPKYSLGNSPFKSKFSDNNNFKVSSELKVGSESQSSNYQKTKFGADFASIRPHFKLQEVPNLYPSEDSFRPSVGYPGNKLFEPSSDNEDYIQQQLSKNPASKGQYQQYLKSQEDEKIEQQAVLEQIKYQQSKPKVPQPPPSKPIHHNRPPQTFSGSSTKYRPYITVKKNFIRKKPLVRVSSSPGLSHYRTPVIEGPYTIHFSV